jgi:hypothetical protein
MHRKIRKCLRACYTLTLFQRKVVGCDAAIHMTRSYWLLGGDKRVNLFAMPGPGFFCIRVELKNTTSVAGIALIATNKMYS